MNGKKKKVPTNRVLNDIIKRAFIDIKANGIKADTIAYWLRLYRQAASGKAFIHTPASVIEPQLRAIFKREVTSGNIIKRHGGIAPLTLKAVQPKFRQLLEDRIKSNIQLIKLERPNSIDVSTARFSRWMLDGLQMDVTLPEAYKSIQRPITDQLAYEHRRRAIDQGTKMLAAIDEVLAVQGGAIVAVWHSHPPTAYYQARPEHWALNKKAFVIKGGWAYQKGLLKKGDNGFMEDLPSQPAHEIYCSCYYEHLYTIAEVKRKYPELIK